MKQPGDEKDTAGGLHSLYPFLYPTKNNPDAVLEQVRRSTEEKVREIMDLRDQLGRDMASQLGRCAEAMARSFLVGGKLLAFGNGGSATDAQAVAQLFLDAPVGQPLPAFSLTNDVAVVTSLANDIGFAVVFARQIAAFGTAGDIAFGLSTSGNSDNVIRAFDEADRHGLLTVGFTGDNGGKMAEARSIEYLFVVPSSSIHRIQEAQTTLYHVLWELTQEALKEMQSEMAR